MGRITVLFLFAIFPSVLLADSTTANFYVIKRDCLKTGNATSISSMGKKTDKQPAFNGGLILAPNTNYYVTTLPQKDGEKDQLMKYINAGKATLIRRIHNVNGEWDSRIGGTSSVPWIQEVNPLPKDFYKDWSSVEKTTPTATRFESLPGDFYAE